MFHNPLEIFCNVRCIYHQEKSLFSHFVNQQVVYRSTFGIQHHAVKDFTDFGISNIVGENMIDVSLAIGACDENFAHVRNVEYSGGMAYCIMLFDDCRIFDGHVESAEWHHFGSQVEMFLVQACF